MGSAAGPPTVRPEIARVTALAPLPDEEDCPDDLIMEMDAAFRAMPMQVTNEEALALLDVLATPDPSSFYSAMWTIVHAVESAPDWPRPQLWPRVGPWLERLRVRARNGGFAPPG
jgi:hypothetical protein